VRAAAPASRELASVALEAHPENAQAHFWLARALVDAGRDPETGSPETPDPDAVARAIELFRRGLELAPRDGEAWLHLGELLAGRDPGAALDAYARACRLGDPQGAACYNAGRLAERAGDAGAAVRFYRRSRLWLAHSKAIDLQRRGGRE
jgi:tetratricopeptide (TPR) repeat protein